MSEPSIFTKIINREVPAHFIYEDDAVVAFLDAFPETRGHSLVVPKTAVDQIWDLDDDSYQHLMSVTKRLGLHLREQLDCDRVGMAVEGFLVPHVHVHLIPLTKGLHDTFQDEKYSTSQAELAALATELYLH